MTFCWGGGGGSSDGLGGSISILECTICGMTCEVTTGCIIWLEIIPIGGAIVAIMDCRCIGI